MIEISMKFDVLEVVPYFWNSFHSNILKIMATNGKIKNYNQNNMCIVLIMDVNKITDYAIKKNSKHV